MQIHRQDRTLRVEGVRELNAASRHSFRDAIVPALSAELDTIEIDLSDTPMVDGSGLAELMSVFKAANERRRDGVVTIRLLNPLPPVRQMFELTRLHHVFEIISQGEHIHGSLPANSAAS